MPDRASSIHLAGQPLSLIDPTRIYVCGITPYKVTHLGHAATYVWVDTLARVLRAGGIEPLVCRNVTDVDDVLTAAAGETDGESIDRYAYLQQYDFDRDMAALGVRRPEFEPRARHHVEHVVAVANALVESGAAYESAGCVFFPGESVVKAAGLDRDQALELLGEFNGRLDDPAKRDPLDQAVWQSSGAGEPAWPSPWGPGRPGWHSECTAMALTTFGPSLDIHAGGADLAFPHHAFEAAMAEALTGVRPFARRWMRVGVVRIGGAKMAKSTGNLVLVDDLLKSHEPAAIRLMLTDRRWNEQWDYEPALLDAAAERLDTLRVAAGKGGSDDAARVEIAARLRDDLDVAGAVDVAIDSGGLPAAELISLLGLD